MALEMQQQIDRLQQEFSLQAQHPDTDGSFLSIAYAADNNLTEVSNSYSLEGYSEELFRRWSNTSDTLMVAGSRFVLLTLFKMKHMPNPQWGQILHSNPENWRKLSFFEDDRNGVLELEVDEAEVDGSETYLSKAHLKFPMRGYKIVKDDVTSPIVMAVKVGGGENDNHETTTTFTFTNQKISRVDVGTYVCDPSQPQAPTFNKGYWLNFSRFADWHHLQSLMQR